MRELQEYYSFGEVLDMVDVIQTDHHNQELAHKEHQKELKRKPRG